MIQNYHANPAILDFRFWEPVLVCRHPLSRNWRGNPGFLVSDLVFVHLKSFIEFHAFEVSTSWNSGLLVLELINFRTIQYISCGYRGAVLPPSDFRDSTALHALWDCKSAVEFRAVLTQKLLAWSP